MMQEVYWIRDVEPSSTPRLPVPDTPAQIERFHSVAARQHSDSNR
jgi:hypothetical protein